MKLQLTRAEVDAIANYIWIHCRSYPDSAAYRVWLRMDEFLQSEPEPVVETQEKLFDN